MSSPTQRTLEKLRGEKYFVAIVEKYNPHARVRQDLFGFIDVIAIRPGKILGVQCTSGSNHSAHLKKIVEERNKEASAWLDAGGEIELWSWRRLVAYRKDGTKSLRPKWEPLIKQITYTDL